MSDMEQKLLTAKGDELSRLLGRVFEINNACMCHTNYGLTYNASRDMRSIFCTGCGGEAVIITDWNVAMKWRDWAVAEYGEVKFKQAMIDVYSTTTERLRINFSSWLALYAQPEHYEIAAALCKLKGNEDE